MRTARRRRSLLLGRQQRRTARRHDTDRSLHAQPRRRHQRDCGRAAGVGRRLLHMRGAGKRRSALLGRQCQGATRRRDDGAATAASAGAGPERCGRSLNGAFHTCATRSNGTLRCWGDNFAGQLGDGSTTDQLAPVLVIGLQSATAIDNGLLHTCALRSIRFAACWGQAATLGDGTATNHATPVSVAGLSNVLALATGGGDHTCALQTGGTVRCWGSNFVGQLGDDTTAHRYTPVPITGVASVIAVAAGSEHDAGS
jgi:Regulator of chromosome condensation (RCC1) repeat